MVIIAGATFGAAVFLLAVSMVTSFAATKKLKNAAFLITNEISYTIVVFITPCMVTAVAIEAQ